MKKEAELRKLVREEIKNVLQEKGTFTGTSGKKLNVRIGDFDSRTATTGIQISVGGSRPVRLSSRQAKDLIKQIKSGIIAD